MVFGTDDLDLVAIVEFRHQRREIAVDLGADGIVADVRMHGIGEVDHRRTARQRDQAAFRREAEDLIVKQLQFRMFEKFLGTVADGEQRERFLEPAVGAAFGRQLVRIDRTGAVEGRRAADAVLVEEMRGDPLGCEFVHILGPDLQFDALMAGTDNGRVQRTIVVLFWRRDVVLEPARHHRPFRVDGAQHAVTIVG